MREKRLHLCQMINSLFLEFGTLNERQFNEAIKTALEVKFQFFGLGIYKICFQVSEDVLEPGENRDTIRAECNAMLKKGFYFQIEKLSQDFKLSVTKLI